MPRNERIDAEATAIAERVMARVAKLREHLARGRLVQLDEEMGHNQGHYSRVLRPRGPWQPEKRSSLSIREASRILGWLGVDPGEYFAPFLDFDLDLYLRDLERKNLRQVRALKRALSRAEPFAGGEEEIRRRVEGLEEERLLDQAAAERACHQLLAALVGEELAECRYEVWGVLAAILRKRGKYSPAAYALRKAIESAKMSGRRLAEARTLQRASYLVADQGDFEHALAQARAAFLIYAEELDLPGMGRALVELGILSNKRCDSKAAIKQFQAALMFLPEHAWHSRLAALEGLGVEHAKCGQLDGAQRRLEQAVELLDRFEIDSPNPRSQVEWLAAEIALTENKLGAAEIGFRAVRSSYLEHASPLDIALVSVRLVNVLFVAGKLDDLRDLAREMSSLVKPLERESKLLGAAFGDFLRIAARGKLTARILDFMYQKLRTGAFLKKAPA